MVDFGLPGPDRGEGGRFLLVPPAYDGPLPDSGYHVGHSRTTRAFLLGRAFMVNDDPAPTVELDQAHDEIYPYAQGGLGASIATLLECQVDSWCHHLNNYRLRVMARPSRERASRHGYRAAGRALKLGSPTCRVTR
jgi:hypothetical protein